MLLLLTPRLGLDLSPELRKLLYPLGAITIAVVGMRAAGHRDIPAALGLNRFNARGVLVVFVGSLAMLAGLAIGADELPSSVDLGACWRSAIQPGFVEEVLFRGFAFGLLRWGAGWSFPAAMTSTAVFFGSAHLPGAILGGHMDQALGAAVLTGVGGGWFAWLYERWDRSLWLAIAAHVFMNLWWVSFTAGPTAVGGGPGATWGRVAAIALITVATIRMTPQMSQDDGPEEGS